MKFNALKASEIMNGIVKRMDAELVFTGVSTDTRTIKPGDLFVAIKGENFDGAEYVDAAFEKGAACAVTSTTSENSRVITVEDPVKALGELARHHLSLHNVPVIAVTGSVGKTTVKDMLISVLGKKYKVHSTSGNKNNHIGLPMTIMNLNNNHDISVLEMGMSDLGEIDYLSYIASPDHAIITNIGMSHIGILGSRENILKAKSEVMNHMKDGGIVLVNGDDNLLADLEVPNRLKIQRFGKSDYCDFRVQDISAEENGNCSFTSGGTRFILPVPGAHNAINAMAVIAMARMLDVCERDIQKGLLEFSQSRMRMNIYEKKDIKYINDAYNANPQSMIAALDILGTSKGRKIAVLGDMLEMGIFSANEHVKIGAYAAAIADILLLCGNEAENMRTGALESGAKCAIQTFETSADAAAVLRKTASPGDTVLVKGSRGMKMENVLEYTKDGGIK